MDLNSVFNFNFTHLGAVVKILYIAEKIKKKITIKCIFKISGYE